jgi:Holliday junction resolvase RusA-like endonuclease
MTLSIPGGPVVLKNSKQIIRIAGRTIIKSSPKVEAYQHRAIGVLCEQWGSKAPITEPINLVIRSYGAWKRSSGNLPDASNLYQMPEDLLEAAGIIADDRQIESHDGSRRVCMCDTCNARLFFKRGPQKGQRKPDCEAVKKCPYQRVELELVVLKDTTEATEE